MQKVFGKHLFKIKHYRLASYQSKEVNTRGNLQVRLLIQRIKHYARAEFAFYVDYHSHTETVGFVS